jgi:hypothetical protein
LERHVEYIDVGFGREGSNNRCIGPIERNRGLLLGAHPDGRGQDDQDKRTAEHGESHGTGCAFPDWSTHWAIGAQIFVIDLTSMRSDGPTTSPLCG